MTMHTNVGGTWEVVSQPSTKVGVNWQGLTNGYVNVSGTWEDFYTQFVLGDLIPDDAGNNYSQVTIASDGTSVGLITGNTGSWGSPTPIVGIGSDYELWWNLNSGSTPSGTKPTMNVYGPLTSDIFFSLSSTTISKYSVLEIRIREISNTGNNISAIITLSSPA